MTKVLITFKIMPESVDVSLTTLEQQAKTAIEQYGGIVQRVEKDPIGFGLVALKIVFAMDESKGATDVLEEQLKTLPGIMNVEVTDVRRALG